MQTPSDLPRVVLGVLFIGMLIALSLWILRPFLPALLWADPEGDAARRWAALPEQDEENVAAQIESIQRRAAIAKFIWPIPDRGLRKRLHRISAPTLLLWGAQDRVNPVVYAESWRERIRGASVSTVAGGHMLLHEAPQASARTLSAFLMGV